MSAWYEHNGKAILNVGNLTYTKKVKVRKVWTCGVCRKDINKGEFAVRQGIQEGIGGTTYDEYFHMCCCEVKLFDLPSGKYNKVDL